MPSRWHSKPFFINVLYLFSVLYVSSSFINFILAAPNSVSQVCVWAGGGEARGRNFYFHIMKLNSWRWSDSCRITRINEWPSAVWILSAYFRPFFGALSLQPIRPVPLIKATSVAAFHAASAFSGPRCQDPLISLGF